ncbi:hypothetical protein ABT063_51255 [Streptomyces sp. NPDC002838]|uniref:hypothetical protein n=1 Tax=Streptomyces sp. NPDC002838 TaxID=3154436 RepID=UPI0033311DBC
MSAMSDAAGGRKQRPRLIEIIRSLSGRIAEAWTNGWLGEVQGLQVSLTKAKEKLPALDRRLERTGPTTTSGVAPPTSACP